MNQGAIASGLGFGNNLTNMNMYEHTLVADQSCQYYYYDEFKTVHVMCMTSEGILSKLQTRIL